MSRHMIRRALLPLAVLLFLPAPASAKIVLITHGDTIAHLGDITADQKAFVRQQVKQVAQRDLDVQVGYKYSYFGVFWLDLWTWGGTYCLYQGKDFMDIPPQMAAMFLGKSEGDLSTPFWYRFPPLLLILIGLGILLVAAAIFKKSPQQRAQQLLEDVRIKRPWRSLPTSASAKWKPSWSTTARSKQARPPLLSPNCPTRSRPPWITSWWKASLPLRLNRTSSSCSLPACHRLTLRRKLGLDILVDGTVRI